MYNPGQYEAPCDVLAASDLNVGFAGDGPSKRFKIPGASEYLPVPLVLARVAEGRVPPELILGTSSSDVSPAPLESCASVQLTDVCIFSIADVLRQ